MRNTATQREAIFESEGILHGVEALASFLTLNGLNIWREAEENTLLYLMEVCEVKLPIQIRHVITNLEPRVLRLSGGWVAGETHR